MSVEKSFYPLQISSCLITLLKTVCFTWTKEASDPLTKDVLQAIQTGSSSSCCGFGSTWRFPSIRYGLHAGQRQCGQCVSAVWVRFMAESGAGSCYSTVT